MNQITISAPDLKQALPGLSKVIPRKATLPVLQTVRVTRSPDGVVRLSATDLDAFVSYRLEQPQPGPVLDLLLPYEALTKTAKGSTGDLSLILESKLKARLKYQVSGSPLEQSVTTLPVDEFPPCPEVAQTPVKMPENFGECLREAFETSSNDSSRYVLQGAYLDVQDPKCHTIVSTNGRALFAANTFQFDFKSSINLSRQKFLEWPGFLTGECELAVKTDKANSSWVKLATPRWICTVKQIDGNFPNWRQVVPQDTENWTKIQLSEAAIKQMLGLSSKLPGDDSENRPLQIRADKELHLEGKNKDDKEFTGAVIPDVKIVGKPIVTALNREYLQTALRCGLNEIRIQNELTPLLFLKPGKRLVVMPVRLQGPVTAPPKAEAPKPAPEKPPTITPPATTPAEERKTDMTQATTKPTAKPAAKPSLIDQVETIKDALKNVIRDLTGLADAVKQAEKDNRASEKEVETVRATLKKLQQVSI